MQWWKRLTTFLQEVVVETKKVSWPSRQEVSNTTIIVIVASFIFGIYLYLCDFAFQQIVWKVFGLFGITQE